MIVRDVGHDSAWEEIYSWLWTCRDEHAVCRQQLSSNGDKYIRPTYVLDISVMPAWPDEIKLRFVADSPITYATLSYCRGVLQPNAMKSSKIDTYMQGINVLLLPQTIQDAIAVTRKLGLQFLWVDSLCIMQDSDEHKSQEIGKMRALYNNAYRINCCIR
jgi:Heterokaryon incompatibility protein (HET)